MAAGTKGTLVQIIGAVVDAEFPPDQLPNIYNAIEIPREDGSTLIAETQQHLGNNWVRTVAMSGGGSLLRNIDKLLTQVTGVPCHVAENALNCVALGTGLALEHFEFFRKSLVQKI